MSAVEDRSRRGARESGLDVLLTDGATGGPGRFVQPRALARTVSGLARRPHRIARRAGGLMAELGRVAVGSSEIEVPKGDRRFKDKAWADSWLFRRTLQSYLATGQAVHGLIDDAELDWVSGRHARIAAGNVLDALAPTNFPWSNPTVIKQTIDQGGANFVDGARRFAHDVLTPPRLPASVDTSKFEIGGNIVMSEGSVVLRTEVFELLHYAPTTEQVHETPLLFVPPTINKYYILDLAPGRSMVEHLLAQGHQVFLISWRNPGEEQGHFDLDTYAAAVLEARDAVAEIAGQKKVNINAACSGGIITAALMGHLAQKRKLTGIASLTLMVCALDNARAGDVAAMASREVAAMAVAESARRGYVDGRTLAGVFAWLRPNDMIWGYVVNNYLLGKPPPAFDILYWNQDTVRLAAGAHRDFIRLALDNSLIEKGGLTVLGSPVDLSRVKVDSYVVAGINDHIVPWGNAFRSVELLGGTTRFVLTTSGHVQALINPPSPESRSSYRVADQPDADAEGFLESAPRHAGSWWPDYVEWLSARAGPLRDAPKTLGSEGFPVQATAPGTYVMAS